MKFEKGDILAYDEKTGTLTKLINSNLSDYSSIFVFDGEKFVSRGFAQVKYWVNPYWKQTEK